MSSGGSTIGFGTSSDGPASREQRLRRACADLDGRLRRGESARAETYFAADPDLTVDPEVAVELIYTEYAARQELGRRPRALEFYRRFPRWRRPLEEQFQIHSLVAGGVDERLVNDSSDRDGGGAHLIGESFQGIGAVTVGDASPAAVQGQLWLDRYEMGAELGRGGMGIVYEARDVTTDSPVAVKLLLSGLHATEAERASWRREAAAEASLRHRNIVQVHAVGEHRGHPSLVLERVSGPSLAKYLAGRPQPPRAAATLVEKLARAVNFAHERGVIHRDLKPSNVLLAPKPETDVVAWASAAEDGARYDPKIGDFGLSKRWLEDSNYTQSGKAIGTPSYMAPEQTGCAKYIGPATDVYSLGAILYELLTGRPPFAGDTALETMRQVVWDEPKAPRRLMASVPRDLETICLKCLRKAPQDRYATAAALADDLVRFLEGRAVAARPLSLSGQTLRWARRRPSAAALAVVIVVAAATLVAMNVRHTFEVERTNERLVMALREAETQRARAAQEEASARQENERFREQLDRARRGVFAERLMQAGSLWRVDPGRALELLEDEAHCPKDLHDFAWCHLYRLCAREVGRIDGPEVAVSWGGFSPDGQRVATIGADEVVRWWSVEPEDEHLPWRETHAFPAADARLVAAAWDADSQSLKTIDCYGEVRELHESGEVEHLASFPAATELSRAAIHSGGRLLVLAYPTGDVRLCDLVAKTTLKAWSAHKGDVACVAISPDATRLFTGGFDHKGRIWAAPTGKHVADLPGQIDVVTAAAFTPNGKRLATGHQDQLVRVWRGARCELTETMRGHVGQITALSFSSDGATIASASSDRSVRLWFTEGKRAPVVFKEHHSATSGVEFSADGRRLLSTDLEGQCRIWRVGAVNPSRNFVGHEGPITALAFSKDGASLVSAARDETLRVWDLASGLTRVRADGVKQVRGVKFSPDSQLFYSVGDASELRVWNAGSGEVVGATDNAETPLWGLDVSPDGRHISAAGDDGNVYVWDAAPMLLWTTIKPFLENAACTAFSPDGRLLAFAGKAGSIVLWDVATEEVVYKIAAHADWVHDLKFSPDGQTLASASYDETVKLWDVGTRSLKLTLHGHAAQAMHLSFSPDGETIVVGAGDRSASVGSEVKVWDAKTGRLRLRLPGRCGPVAFSPDGTVLATGDEDGVVRIWLTTDRRPMAKLTPAQPPPAR